jgi:hypothetical protein
LYVTPHARTWLEKTRHVRVLHVFDGVCNLIDMDSEVMSLVIPQIGRGPFSVVVPPLRFPDHITPDDPVICRPDSVKIGRISVDLDTASIWNPRPAWDDQTRDRLYHYRSLLIRALRDLAPANSLAALIVDLPGSLSETDAAILQTARAASSELIAGLQTNALDVNSGTAHAAHSATTIIGSSIFRVCSRIIMMLLANSTSVCRRGVFQYTPTKTIWPTISIFQEGVSKLAGLGIGATPAGDDWLVGGTLAFWSMLPDTEAESIGALIAGIAAPRTTQLSAAWLYAAARGECHEHWHALLRSIQADDEGAAWAAAAALIRHGHTSGADALAGFVMVLTALPDSPVW